LRLKETKSRNRFAEWLCSFSFSLPLFELSSSLLASEREKEKEREHACADERVLAREDSESTRERERR
jgi:hypothetical protein